MYYKVNDNSYWVETYGNGEPVIMLHGFTGSVQTWYSIKDMLLENYQVILIELPGHGRTEAVVDSMKACCHDLAVLFKQMNLSEFHLLGYSMGGRTALAFTIYYPHFVKTLLLESATAGIEDKTTKKDRVLHDHNLASYILRNSLEDFINKWEKTPLFATQLQLPTNVKAKIRKERLMQTKEGLASSLQTMGTGSMPSFWETLPQIICEVCIIVGADDKKFVQIGKRMKQMLVNSELRIVQNSGHAIHVEQTEIFGTIVNEFISRRRTSHVN
ncbi:2-succinyl-6-hydroxy-2,4-cyclohexadiene-1-carboxylate synthase [Gracilibacillus oryzae]|uniref:Putative 2-succinyl-6-hydroxy-2,4-cyclohexadiene-1-carboxylate synthase n=1 Tax=Gracilibacillus oryzae TaxID=1672701 RepID=A0A7C8L6E5_9BACI|nr:2-succinyl-6-hydroxy-2,4-cyclohexadiene-1-carboxylate synthase [Gracilibacillus oryzae]KAB8131471.1 2-succinyl-6-hydroxy-2,4-cyclohexadiene-1-carboxylate synthase [Gracilibacillus oryzae]